MPNSSQPASDEPADGSIDAGTPQMGIPSEVSLDAGTREEASDRPIAPTLLSQTGCFLDTTSNRVAAEFIPYVIRSALWTDGAHKERYFSIPEGTAINVRADGTWEWPIGSVLLKTFSFDFPTTTGAVRRPVETRLMKRFPDGIWQYWSYRWNEQGTDARVLADAADAYLTIADRDEPLHYAFPSELSCRTCHGFHSEGVLGPTAMQLDLEVFFQGTVRRQLDLLADLSIVERQQLSPSGLVNPANETATIEARARSYLHGNCAHCHHPGGYAPPDVDMDLRFRTPFKDAHLCSAYADYASSTAELRIMPGKPEESDLWLRFTSNGLWRMPVIGTGLHDPLGEEVLKEWIETLQGCPQ